MRKSVMSCMTQMVHNIAIRMSHEQTLLLVIFIVL